MERQRSLGLDSFSPVVIATGMGVRGKGLNNRGTVDNSADGGNGGVPRCAQTLGMPT